jgi:hypothetical protein
MPAKKRGLSKQRAFLASYVVTASILKAAKAAKVNRSLHYRWLKEDDEYKIAFAAAYLEAGDSLEDEAVRRAHEGIQEPLIYQGNFSYKQRVVKDAAGVDVLIAGKQQFENYGKPLCVNTKSDTLLMFLLKGFKREKYRENASLEVSGPDGGPIPLEDARLKDLSDDELAALIVLTQKLK